MKKKKIINITIIITLILIILGIGIYYITNKSKKINRQYEIEQISKYNYFMYRNQDKFGVIDKTGNIIIEALYEQIKIPNPTKPIFICINENKSKVLNEKNQEIFSEFSNIEALRLKNISTDLIYEKNLLKYEEDKKIGLINLKGEKIEKPIYEEIDTLEYKEGELITKKDGKYGIINQNGYVLINNEYDKIKADSYYDKENGYKNDGYIIANKTNEGYRYGYISYDGKKYLDTIYNDVKRILEINNEQDIYLLAAENGRYGIFKNNKKIIENKYQSITYDNFNSIFIVQEGKKYGVFDKEGKEILKCEYLQIDIKGEKIHTKNIEGKEEVYDNKGNLTKIPYDTTILNIEEKKNYSIRIKNAQGKTIYQIYKEDEPISKKYMYIQHLENDVFIASKKDGKLGIININDEEKTEFKYTSIQRILDTNLIKLTKENKIEILNINAEKIFEIENANIEKIGEFIKIQNNEKTAYFTKEGQEVSNKEVYKENILYSNEKNGKWGYVDSQGNTKVENIYDKVTEFNQYGFAGIKKDGKWGVINQNGEILVETKYEFPEQDIPEFIGTYYQVKYGFGQIYYKNN